MGVLILWELVEIGLRYLDLHAPRSVAALKPVIGFAFEPETAANIIGDLLIGALGLALGRQLAGKKEKPQSLD